MGDVIDSVLLAQRLIHLRRRATEKQVDEGMMFFPSSFLGIPILA
jgi:hypothetical protein